MKPKPLGLEKQFEVSYVNPDGSVGILAIARDGTAGKEVTVIQMDQLAKYQAIEKQCRIKQLPLVEMQPCIDSLKSPSRMIAEFALHSAYKKHMAS